MIFGFLDFQDNIIGRLFFQLLIVINRRDLLNLNYSNLYFFFLSFFFLGLFISFVKV